LERPHQLGCGALWRHSRAGRGDDVERLDPECLLVHPNGENSFYADYLDGSRRYEQLVVDEIPRYVEEKYRALTDRRHRALGGVSMGGYGALKIAFKYPDRYATVAAVSPIILTGDDPSVLFNQIGGRMAQFLSRALQPVFGVPFDRVHWKRNSVEALADSAEIGDLKIFFAYGTADRYNDAFPIEHGLKTVDGALTRRGIEHTFVRYENGPHGWQLVGDHLEEIARFLCQTF
jgi:S-formylglutathione hydrolase FrmB